MKLEEMLNKEKNKTVPDDFHSFFEDTINSIPNKRKNETRKVYKTAAIILVILFMTPVISTYGSDILKGVFNLKDVIRDEKTADLYIKYTKDEAVTVPIDNYIVTINNIGYDDNFFVYGYSIERKDGEHITEKEYMQINVLSKVEEFKSISNGNSDVNIEENKFSMICSDYIDGAGSNLQEVKSQFIITNNIKAKKTEKVVNIDIKKSDGAITTAVKLDKEVKTDGGSIYLDKIVFSPFKAIFSSETRGKYGDLNKSERDPYYYAIFDELGEQIWMGNTSIHQSGNGVTKIQKKIDPSEYLGKNKYTIKVYDSRTKSEVKDSSITIDIPNIY